MSELLSHAPVEVDDITKRISKDFDYPFDGVSNFKVPDFPEQVSNDFNIGLIVGPSGTGKSTLLKKFGTESFPEWDSNKCIASHFESYEDATTMLGAVGLNSVPTWLRPFYVLSEGEKYRADLSRRLKDNSVIDEFTSVVNRSVAKSCANSISKHIRKTNMKGIVFSSCHYDIEEWLDPDWIYDTSLGEFTFRGSLHRPDRRRPSITLELLPCGPEAWSMFKDHHYLTEDLNKSALHWLAVWEGNVVGFASAIYFPSGTINNAYRGHRTVILPDYQGLGLGVRLSDAIGQIFINSGYRYYTKTAHPRMGHYRNNSPLWRNTCKNGKNRRDYSKSISGQSGNVSSKWNGRSVESYSHEFIGHKEQNGSTLLKLATENVIEESANDLSEFFG